MLSTECAPFGLSPLLLSRKEPSLWITVLKIGTFDQKFPVFSTVIHCQNDEGYTVANWHVQRISGIILLEKGVLYGYEIH